MKPILVLDLDNTLVYSHQELFTPSDFVLRKGKEALSVMKRPGVDNFLENMSRFYTIVIFSAAESTYVNSVVDQLDPEKKFISRILHAEECDKPPEDLKVKSFDIQQWLPRFLRGAVSIGDLFVNHKKLRVDVPKFEGSRDDKVLQEVTPFLQSFKKAHFAILVWKAGGINVVEGGWY